MKSENDLLDVLNEIVKNDNEYSTLLRFIEIKFLDCKHLDLFLGQIFPELLSSSLWASICHCLHRYNETNDNYRREMYKSDRFFKKNNTYDVFDELSSEPSLENSPRVVVDDQPEEEDPFSNPFI